MAGEMNLKAADQRIRSFSVAGPVTDSQRSSLLASGATTQRRGSRALDVKGAKSETPLGKWISEHVDKQMVGLGINFLILVVLLMLLKVVVQWIQLTQMAAKGMAAQQAAANSADNP